MKLQGRMSKNVSDRRNPFDKLAGDVSDRARERGTRGSRLDNVETIDTIRTMQAWKEAQKPIGLGATTKAAMDKRDKPTGKKGRITPFDAVMSKLRKIKKF